jgi:hypothetical protein
VTEDELVAWIRTLEDRRLAAMRANDVGTLMNLISKRAAYAHSSGDRDSRFDYLERIRNRTLVYQAIECPIERIIAMGDSAVVVGKMIGTLKWNGEVRHINNLSLAVWAREEETWRLVAFQPTKLPA